MLCVCVCFLKALLCLRLYYVWTLPCTPSQCGGMVVLTVSKIWMRKCRKFTWLQFPDSIRKSVILKLTADSCTIPMKPSCTELCSWNTKLELPYINVCPGIRTNDLWIKSALSLSQSGQVCTVSCLFLSFDSLVKVLSMVKYGGVFIGVFWLAYHLIWLTAANYQ